jgi:predicted MPP superfamily phosphohydrolase
MDMQPHVEPIDARLEERITPLHLSQRLGIESEHEAQVFGQGRNFFHIENWYSIHSVIRNLLRMTFLYGRGRRNILDLAVRRNQIRLAHLPATLSGFTLLHISDLHLDAHPGMIHALIEKVSKVDYDLCVLTGDFRARTFGPFDSALQDMAKLRPHLKGEVFGVLGNHDSIRMVPALEAMDIHMLMNESAMVESNGECLYLSGIDDAHYYRADNLEKAALDIPRDAVSILLSHTPEIYRHAAYAGFDLMLCGHTHGGQFCLPGGIPITCNANCPRSLCRGPWHHHGMQGYTSPGVGVSVVDVRFNCPPEITLHTLEPG